MAMTLFRGMLDKRGLSQKFRDESAGTWASVDQPASAGVFTAMQKRSLDVSAHRSRQVTRELLADYDLILTMELGHKEALLVEFPEVMGRVFMLSEMVGEIKDVDDPIGTPDEEYEKTAQLLENWLRRGFDRIMTLVYRERETHPTGWKDAQG
jgi:protein-tyrosine-phosphatase